jgi:dTDP-L-rhamnose 4-epimerase
MTENVLVTGGAGFIGSHVVDALLRRGSRVRVLDVLHPQVHGPERRPPRHLDARAELVVGDVRERHVVDRALRGVDVVVHLAALVGVGQSMYCIDDYTSVNELGTAVLLQALSQQRPRKLVVASSMSVYGEGLYRRPDGRVVPGRSRSLASLEAHRWELVDGDGAALTPIPTPEGKEPALDSVYALNKYAQERMSLIVGRAYGIPTVALRLFNVYGPRQALSNPYTGVLAIFASRLLNGNPPLIFEDGEQRRDFVSVHDVARAFLLAIDGSGADGLAVNVGSGREHTVRDIAERVSSAIGRPIPPELSNTYRKGDIRHCYADLSLAREALGYEPNVSLEEGLRELASWMSGQTPSDSVAQMREELSSRGLTL